MCNTHKDKLVTYIEMNGLKCAGHVIGVEEQSDTGRAAVVVVEGRGAGRN